MTTSLFQQCIVNLPNRQRWYYSATKSDRLPSATDRDSIHHNSARRHMIRLYFFSKGPLRVVVYPISGPSQPHVATRDRLEPVPAPGQSADEAIYTAVCEQCHAATGSGGNAPPARQNQLADPELLKQFLVTVPQPMLRLYSGLLNEQGMGEVDEYLRTKVFNSGPNE